MPTILLMEIPAQLLLVLVTILAVAMITAYSVRLIMLERNIVVLSTADATAYQIMTAIVSTMKRAYNLGKLSTTAIEVEQHLELNRNFIFKILKNKNGNYILQIESFASDVGSNKLPPLEYLLPFYSFPCNFERKDLMISYVETEGRCSTITVKVRYDPINCVLSVHLKPS